MGKEQREGRREGGREAGRQAALRAPVTRALPKEACGSQSEQSGFGTPKQGSGRQASRVRRRVSVALCPSLGRGPRSVPR